MFRSASTFNIDVQQVWRGRRGASGGRLGRPNALIFWPLDCWEACEAEPSTGKGQSSRSSRQKKIVADSKSGLAGDRHDCVLLLNSRRPPSAPSTPADSSLLSSVSQTSRLRNGRPFSATKRRHARSKRANEHTRCRRVEGTCGGGRCARRASPSPRPALPRACTALPETPASACWPIRTLDQPPKLATQYRPAARLAPAAAANRSVTGHLIPRACLRSRLPGPQPGPQGP